jgi:hypothetical protein
VRHRDQQATEATTLTGGAIAIQYDKWFALEDGVQVQFPAPAAPNEFRFRTGGYWLIPARVATRDIEWPWEDVIDNPPQKKRESASAPSEWNQASLRAARRSRDSDRRGVQIYRSAAHIRAIGQCLTGFGRSNYS